MNSARFMTMSAGYSKTGKIPDGWKILKYNYNFLPFLHAHICFTEFNNLHNHLKQPKCGTHHGEWTSGFLPCCPLPVVCKGYYCYISNNGSGRYCVSSFVIHPATYLHYVHILTRKIYHYNSKLCVFCK